MKKIYQIIRINIKDFEEKNMGEFDTLFEAVSKAEDIWEEKKKNSQSDFERMEVRHVTKANKRIVIYSGHIVWLSEWYDAMNRFGLVTPGYTHEFTLDSDVTSIEEPKYCKIGMYEFYHAYGIDYNGKRYLIEWAMDNDINPEKESPYNYGFPDSLFYLGSYDGFPTEPSKFK